MYSTRENEVLTTVLKQLKEVQPNEQGYQALCPAHDDRKPSLSIAEGEGGRILLNCFAGCDTKRVVEALSLSMSDLFPKPTLRVTVRDPHGCTLQAYADVKGVPVKFLRGLGLSETRHQEKAVIRIPYRGTNGEETAVRYRTALEKPEGKYNRFKWKSGSKPTLYGLERLDMIKEAGFVVLVEGESDAHTLWYHDVPALGIPGANTWKEAWAEYFGDAEKIYVVVEPDKGGETLRKKLTTSRICDRLYLVALGKHKDVSALYLAEPESFRTTFMAALEDATSVAELQRKESEATSRRAWEECKDLAQHPDILSAFARELARCGVAGETRIAKILYLSVTSRLLEKPVSVAVKGPSGGGKSYLTERVLRFFPESSHYALTAMSEHALAYGEEPLSHRMLVIYEAAGMSGDFQTYLIRSLLSEGKVRYETVEKTAEGIRPRLIEREGPTGLIVTTTAVKLHPENETRLLSLTVTDTQEQTRDVMAALAEESSADGPDLTEWHALQEWLRHADNRVTIPYAKELAEMVPPVAVRLRRDFGAILNLVRAHAELHQASRRRDEQGRIIATLEDYAAVRELVADLVSEGIEATVPKTVRETVEVVFLLHEGFDKPVTVAQLAEELKLDKSAALRRARTAIDRSFLKNLEDRKGRPAQLVPGDPLPEDIKILPTVERLQSCSESGGGDDKFFSSNGTEAMREHAGKEDNDSEQLDRGDVEDTGIAGSATTCVEKKVSLDPLENECNRATLQSLTVETAYKEMTRYGSKASYAYDRYRVEPDSRMLGQLVRAVVAGTGMDVTHWQEHAPTVEQAAKRLEADDRAEDERYDRMVEERVASLEADFEEENRNQPESHSQKRCLKAKYIGTVPRHGVTGKAYPRGEDRYWFEPITGAMGIRVGTKDLRFSEPETEHNMSGERQRYLIDTERQEP